jgi:hypothetical protein
METPEIKETETLKLLLFSNCGKAFKHVAEYELMDKIVKLIDNFDVTLIDKMINFYYDYHFEQSKDLLTKKENKYYIFYDYNGNNVLLFSKNSSILYIQNDIALAFSNEVKNIIENLATNNNIKEIILT